MQKLNILNNFYNLLVDSLIKNKKPLFFFYSQYFIY